MVICHDTILYKVKTRMDQTRDGKESKQRKEIPHHLGGLTCAQR